PRSTAYAHLAPGPACRVACSASGCGGAAGGCRTIGGGIISPAGVQKAAVVSAPDDHFTFGPDCRVSLSGRSRVGGAGGGPTIGAGIISPAGVRIAAVIISAPDDHFAAGPHCRGKEPAKIGRAH